MLKIEDLRIASYDGSRMEKEIIKGISLEIGAGRIVGLVGESGSGKSITALSIMGLLASNLKITRGSIEFQGKVLTDLDSNHLETLRGDRITFIFQEPLTSLNPTMKIGRQVEEVLVLHTELDKETRKNKVLKALGDVGLKEPERVYNVYPHQLSGGMRQRVMIAMAILMEPALLIADEPTTALDVTTQRQILDMIRDISRRNNMSVIFITHDLKLARKYCDELVVMRGGLIVEQGPAAQLFENPKEEYTASLVNISRRLALRKADVNE